MTLDELRQLHTEVKEFRAWMDANTEWKTPPKEDALRFAFTEIAESLDAWLRTKGGYARNHTRNLDVFHELSDCALMLMTALPRISLPMDTRSYEPATLEEIGYMCGNAVYYASIDEDDWLMWAEGSLFLISSYPNMDLAAELRSTMEKLKEKHTKPS